MGNSVSENCDGEENTTPAIIEDFERSAYIDNSNSTSKEAIKPNKEHQNKHSVEDSQKLPRPKENNPVKGASAHRDSAEGGGKPNTTKKTKAKQAVGKKDSASSDTTVNGPLSPPANMVKSNQNSVDNMEESSESHGTDQTGSTLEIGTKKDQEEVFVEVKKKKKRVGPKDTSVLLPSSNAPFVPNQFYSRNGNGVQGQGRFRNNGYQRTPLSLPSGTTTSLASTTYTTNATTTPIVSSSNTTLSISSNSSSSSGVEHLSHPPRDLSPSAFPVLEGHSLPSTGTEARRNSCGDATDLLVESKSLCDSDRESVKSLPATYARVASGSGPRRNNSSYPESIASPSSESGLGWQNSSSSSVTYTPSSSCHTTSPGGAPTPHTPERKASTAVWKGSPRERRHSIGSSPAEEKMSSAGAEDCSDTNSMSRNRQKSGSQEFLNRDLSCVSTAASADVSVIKAIHASESSGSLQSDSNLSEDAIGSGSTPDSREFTTTSHQSLKATVSSSSYATQENSAPTTTPPSKQPAEGLSSVPSQPVSAQKSAGNEASDTAAGKKTISQVTKTGSSSSTSSRTSVTASGGNNTKSVVFLDKRTSSHVPSLGITFGFDSTFDSTPESAVKAEMDSSEKVPEKDLTVTHSAQVAATVPSTLSSTSPSSSGQPSGSQNTTRAHNIPPSVASSVPVSTGPAQHRSGDSSASDKKVPKGPHIERLPNGLVVPSHSHHHHQHGRGQAATSSSIVSNNAPPQARLAGPAKPVVGPGHVIPFSPNYPPPPLPQGQVVVALPPQGGSQNPGSSVPESQDFRKLGRLPDVSQPPPVPPALNAAAGAQPGLPPPHHHHNRQQHKPGTILVVYGLKIKPDGGCGKFYFIPPPLVKRAKSKEVSDFLKKSKL